MSEYSCYLITILYEDQLLRVALKTKLQEEYPMEPLARKRLYDQLPLHVRSCGKIVDIQPLFEITINKD